MQRRRFIQGISAVAAGAFFSRSYAFVPHSTEKKKPLTIGWITDVHHGYCADADQRLEAFINSANQKKPGFIIQGGDFCHPTAEATKFLDIWKGFKGPKYHVLGNHDMDKGTKKQIMDLWGMEKPYYSFDQGGFHFVVMDCNHILSEGRYIDYANANFYIDGSRRDLVNPEQIEWLRADLQNAKKPCVIISHQSFDDVWTGYTVPNKLDVRKVIDEVNAASKKPKVIACFCGHHHLDHHMVINGVHYFHINSSSYYYVGDGFGSDGAKAMYADPLFCFVTFDPAGEIIIEGRSSHFVSPTPAEKGYANASRLSASILDKKIKI
jgi:calcineurin-like phosphoesterase family protein